MTMLVPEDDVADGAEEIAEVGAEGSLQVGLDVFALGGLHLFDGLRGVTVVIEGGEEPGLHLGAQLLHLRGVEAEIVTRKGAHTDEFALALEHVEEHGELVDPYLAHPAAPEIDTIVVSELAAGLQTAVLVEVRLQILAVAVHGAELVDTDDFAVLADTAQLDKG